VKPNDKTEAEAQAELQSPTFWDDVWSSASEEQCAALIVAAEAELQKRGSFGKEWLDVAMYQAVQACERRMRATR
jgi:hypothetical protein